MRHLRNIFNLGIKELRSLLGDKAMLTLIVFSFTVSVYSSATVTPGSLNLAPIAIADMDQSQLSNRIVNSFYRPWFLPPEMITADEMDAGLDAGRYTFAINIPPNFQRDVLAGRQPDIQVNVDATRMSQAFTGNGYIQNIINGEVNSFVARYRDNSEPLVSLETRMRFNPNLDPAWFGGVMAIINNITMLAIVLTGSALIREREHGTVEHLLVMPITPFEIMMAKIWSMGLVVLVVSGLSLVLMVKGVLGVPIEGSIPLFMLGVALSLFATTSIGIFMGTIARSMPQLGLLVARPHQLEAIVEKHQPDVIGLQETKVHDDMFPLEEVAKLGYNVFYHGQKGHYGVALLTKETPIAVRRGFPGDDEEAQRRIIMAEIPSLLGNVTVINGYFPQGESRDHPIKFPAKAQFYQNLQNYLETELKRDNPVLIMGDMNISPTDLDIGIGEENRKRWLRTGKCSFLPEEREWMDRLMSWGLVDTFRHANPQTADRFSWFDYRSKGFDDNRGLRIDLLLASQPLAECCVETGIDYEIRSMEKPSDHAPVWATFRR